jgi:Flp pilus assembly pilin Flp
MKNRKNRIGNNRGVGVVEVILILVVLIALVVIFQEQITTLVNSIWKSINSNAGNIFS